jgi:outer membrane lipoprotein-sorting protein
MLIFVTASAQLPDQTRKYQDSQSTEILKNLQKKLNAYTDISIHFTFKTEKDERFIDEIKGVTLIKKDKYVLETPQQKILCDGINIWNYLIEQKEVTVSLYDKEDDSQLMNPMNLINNYEKEYKSDFIRETSEKGVLVQIIDLTSLKATSFYKIRLILNKNKNQIMRFVVFDKDGTQYTYYIDKFLVNQSLSDADFTFDVSKYPDTEVIDIR